MTSETHRHERIDIDLPDLDIAPVIFRTWDGDRILSEEVSLNGAAPAGYRLKVEPAGDDCLPGDWCVRRLHSIASQSIVCDTAAGLKRILVDARAYAGRYVALIAHPDFELKTLDPATRTPGRVTQEDFDLVRRELPQVDQLPAERLDRYVEVLLGVARELASVAGKLHRCEAAEQRKRALKRFFAEAPAGAILVDRRTGRFARLSDTRGTQTKRSLEILTGPWRGANENILARERASFTPANPEDFARIPAGTLSAHATMKAMESSAAAVAAYPGP